MTDKVRRRRRMMAMMRRRWKRVSMTPILVRAPWHKLTQPFQFSTLSKRTHAQSSFSPGMEAINHATLRGQHIHQWMLINTERIWNTRSKSCLTKSWSQFMARWGYAAQWLLCSLHKADVVVVCVQLWGQNWLHISFGGDLESCLLNDLWVVLVSLQSKGLVNFGKFVSLQILVFWWYPRVALYCLPLCR